jgi:hypothetical protein
VRSMTAKPNRTEIYLANAEQLRETVNAYRQARGEEPTPTPTKPRRLPTLEGPRSQVTHSTQTRPRPFLTTSIWGGCRQRGRYRLSGEARKRR